MAGTDMQNHFASRAFRPLSLAAALLAVSLLGGCNVEEFAINKLGDALSRGRGMDYSNAPDAFSSDDDPELVRAAIPFSLKLIESLLIKTPEHEGLLLAACSGFTQYGYAFVQQDADEIEPTSLDAAVALRARALRLYIRAKGYGLRGLEVQFPGVTQRLRDNPAKALAKAKKDDVPLLYWTAAAWGAAIALSKDNPALIADQPIVQAMIDRALELDETFESGALHSFLVSYEPARLGGKGDPLARSRAHFDRAVELSAGHSAGPYLALAETVDIAMQDRAEFEALLNKALAIDADAYPRQRLANLIVQRRARMLLERIDDLFAQ